MLLGAIFYFCFKDWCTVGVFPAQYSCALAFWGVARNHTGEHEEILESRGGTNFVRMRFKQGQSNEGQTHDPM